MYYQIFRNRLSPLVIAQMLDTLKQTSKVDEYIVEYQRIFLLASETFNENNSIVKHVFLKNLTFYVSKFIRDKDCKTL